ncbi:MAG TPA: homoserine dehydrogenase, partial [Chloroflexota bacterium]|nr:homoserine dehydrogenase [Chloroflexota bacterium]
MTCHNLCLIGFGNVGQALVRLLQVRQDDLRARYGIEWRVTGLMTRRLGFHADPSGFDPFALLAGQVAPTSLPAGTTLPQWLHAARAGVLFDTSALNAQTGEPATSYLRATLAAGVHAITANKGPIVHAYGELCALAVAHGK